MKYPEDFINKIICGDCLEVMKEMPDKCVDMILTDPPYGVNKDRWDNLNLEWIGEAHRICSTNGSFYVFGSVWFYPLIHIECLDVGFIPRNVICWYYENAMSRQTKNFQMEYDPIGFFVKRGDYNFNLDTLRIPYKSQERIKHKIIKNGKIWKPHPLGKKRGNVINIPALAGKRFSGERVNHPTQKPLKLVELLIRASSNESEIVFDPFLGSGTTAVACKNLNRNFIGIEINPNYCKIAEERLAQGVL